MANKAVVASVVVLVLLAGAFLAYYENTSGELAMGTRRVSSLQSALSSLQGIPPTTVTKTSLVITTYYVTSTVISTATVTKTPSLWWNQSLFLSVHTGCPNNTSEASCWTLNASLAIIFNCATAAATPEGCTETLPGAGFHSNYTISIWYPYHSNMSSTLNCAYSIPIDGVDHNQAYCVSLNRQSFIVTLIAPLTP